MIFRIPSFMREAFGERQSLAGLFAILLFGLIGTAILAVSQREALVGLSIWRMILALVLVFDILAGCVANFTEGTNDYYARRPAARKVFIAIHVHLPIVALLLGAPIPPALLVWAYTIGGAFLIDAIGRGTKQTFVAGTSLAVGLLIIPILGFDVFMTVVAQLFLLKVLFGFAVDHAGDGRHG